MPNLATSITVTAHIRTRDGKQSETEQVLKALVDPTRREPGCLAYDLLRSCEDPGSYLFIEVWQSSEHLNRHLQQDHLQDFISRSGDLLSEPLQVSIWKKTTGP